MITIRDTFRQGNETYVTDYQLDEITVETLRPIVGKSVGSRYLAELSSQLNYSGWGMLGWSDYKVISWGWTG